MKTIRGFAVGFVVAMAIGGVAGATPAIVHAVTVSHHRPKPQQPELTTTSGKGGKAPDSTTGGTTTATGHTGLANAIDHVSANLADHPNKGLANALSHLRANQAKHEGKHQSKDHRKTGGDEHQPSNN